MGMAIPGAASVIRCYSLSSRPDPNRYRISVKRLPSGIASNFLHDRISEGSIIDVKAPKGKFFVRSTSRRPVVLVGGGVGVTPVLAMLDAHAASGSRRPTYLFFGVRNSSEHCFREQLTMIASRNNVNVHVCYSSPLPEDRIGIDCHSTGHVSVELLKEVFPSLDCDFYVCGPASMMAQLKEDLGAAGVPAKNFHMEAFGAGSVKKITSMGASAERFVVAFELSGKTLEWEPRYSNLLELAEANGIEIECGCRAGNCGSCEVEILSGEVEYVVEPGAVPDEGACLLCVTVPRTDLSLNA